MFGFWYIVFGCIVIAIAGLIVGIVLRRKALDYLFLYKKKYSEYSQLDGNDDPDYSKRRKLRDEYLKYDRLHDKYDDKDFIGWIISIIMGMVLLVLVPLSIFIPLEAQREASYFSAQREYVELAVENGTDLENVAITHTIIEQNEWLACAKASKASYGVFSRYYNVNLDELEPIVIDRGER